MQEYKKHVGKFIDLFMAKLDQGAEDYGNESFERSPDELAREAEEEAIDLAGWAFLRWVVIQRQRAKLQELERMIEEKEKELCQNPKS